jgi:hypothetical protein
MEESKDNFLNPNVAVNRTDRYQDYNEKKRFVLTRLEFAQERMQGIKEVVSKLQKKHPEILSFCMFGSMVKGAAKLECNF